MHSPAVMIQLSILHNSLPLTPATLYICAGQMPLAQVFPFEKREVISMV
jgi:hypothetical protein